MASNHAANSLVDEFENSFQTCLSALTNPDSNHIHDSDEVKTSVELTIQRFLDVARQMECFFLQKRLLLSQQKPELILLEDNFDLRNEIARKDQVLQKFYEKLSVWQNILSETNVANNIGINNTSVNVALNRQASLGQASVASPIAGTPGGLTGASTPSLSHIPIAPPMRHANPMPPMSLNPNQPSLLQAAMSSPMTPPQAGPLSSMNMANVAPNPGMMQMQPQMQPQMQAGMMTPGQLTPTGQPPLPGQQPTPSGAMMGPMGPQLHSNLPFAQQQAQQHASGLQGPLAYLERTTSNIGMSDARR